MVRLASFLVVCMVVGAFAAGKAIESDGGKPDGFHELKIGDPAPDFALKGIDDKVHTLAEFKDAPVLLVAFISNHCPASHAAETRLVPYAKEMAAKGLATVAINPNSPDGLHVGELGYSKYNDGFEDMKLYARDTGITFPFLYDGETQATAKAYGCVCTAHVFVFDKERKLRYAGRWDNSTYADPATVKTREAADAIEALLAGRPVPVEMTKPFGCSTKWIEKRGMVAKVNEAWTKEPVTLETIDPAGAAKLVKNGTNKWRLINVWATWCGPCVAEFPNLVSLSRRMQNREFELITVSMDDPKDRAKVLAFLQEQHAASPKKVKESLASEGRTTNNYLYGGTEAEALMKALDPEASGALPHTIIVSPKGEIVYRRAGTIDSTEVLGKLIDLMGGYYTPGSK
jgi:peroxiredoxin